MSRLMQGLFDFSLSSTARHLRRGRHGICNALHGWKHPQGGASLGFCCPKVLNESPGWCTENKTSGYNLVFQMSNKRNEELKIHNPSTTCASHVVTGSNFPWKLPNFPQLFSSFFVPRFGFMGPPEHCHGPPDHRDKVLLWFCSDMSHVWVLVSLSRWGKKLYSHATAGVIIPQSCQESGLAAFHAIQEGCYISYCRKWYQPNIKQPTHGIAGNNPNKMHNAHFCQ